MKTLLRLLKEEDGTTVFEYALLSALIGLAACTAVVVLGIKYLTFFTS